MTATDPRPALAAALAARLAPAAEALAAAYARDANPEPPPPDDRTRAECHRAGRAQLAHLRELLAVLDWSAAHMPEPEPEPAEEPSDAFDEPPEPPVAESDYDGSEDEFHYRGEVYAAARTRPIRGAGRHGAPVRAGPDGRGSRRQPDRMQCQRAEIRRQTGDARIQGMARTAEAPHAGLSRPLSRRRRKRGRPTGGKP